MHQIVFSLQFRHHHHSPQMSIYHHQTIYISYQSVVKRLSRVSQGECIHHFVWRMSREERSDEYHPRWRKAPSIEPSCGKKFYSFCSICLYLTFEFVLLIIRRCLCIIEPAARRLWFTIILVRATSREDVVDLLLIFDWFKAIRLLMRQQWRPTGDGRGLPKVNGRSWRHHWPLEMVLSKSILGIF
jgi:hypothetical protein